MLARIQNFVQPSPKLTVALYYIIRFNLAKDIFLKATKISLETEIHHYTWLEHRFRSCFLFVNIASNMHIVVRGKSRNFIQNEKKQHKFYCELSRK